MEILALYTSPDALGASLAAGARHLAAAVNGLALVYPLGASGDQPEGWAGFTCAKDAQTAGQHLDGFRREMERSERALRMNAPGDPERIWGRAAGGIFGFALRHAGNLRGVALVGCPGPWPRIRNSEIESVLQQLALVLDHHAMSREPQAPAEPSDELLRLSEQLLTQDLELIKKEERLQGLERLQGDLIERVSSELRSPLNGIIERIISVLASEHESLSDAGRKALRGALDEGNSLIRTLQNILDLCRLKQGEIKIELQDVNLYEVVEEAIFNVRDSLRPDVELEKRLPSGLPKVRTDLAKLNQILFHLLDNAAKFTPRGRIELELCLEEGQLLCNVKDTGVGIAQDDLPHVFDEFFQVDSTPDSSYRGAGLGLTLGRALIERLGGAISLRSEIGHGSQFSFTLPVRS